MIEAQTDELRVFARRLLREARRGALATLMPDGGAPYCSLVATASHPDGSPLLLISRLAVHTRNLLADPRVSLLLSTADAADPLQEARIMIAGVAERPTGDAAALARRRYLAAHPSAELFVAFPDFLLVRVAVQSIHLVAGFGRIGDLTPADVLTDLTGAEVVLEAEEGAVDHMNDDHADTLGLFATKLRGAAAGAWRCTGLDPDGLDLQAEGIALRVDFPSPVTTPGALRAMLVRMVAEARGDAAAH